MTARNFAILIVAVCVLASGAAWLYVRSGAPRSAGALQSQDHATGAAPQNNPAAPDAPDRGLSREGRAPDIPLTDAAAAYDAYMDELALGDRVAQFIANRDRMSADERQREADALLSRVAALEAEDRLIKAQSVYLKAAIYDALDPHEGETARRALLESLAGEPQSDPDPYADDARYKELKRREKEIINEVLSSSHFPDGMTREEYLERELSALSRELYGSRTDQSD